MTPGNAFISECPVPSVQLFMVKLLKYLKMTRTLPSHEADSPTPIPLLTTNCEARNSLGSTELYHLTPSKIDMGTKTNKQTNKMESQRVPKRQCP